MDAYETGSDWIFFFKLGLGWNMFLYFVLVLFLQRIYFIKTLSLTN